jgi:predicted CopG family antitoxin
MAHRQAYTYTRTSTCVATKNITIKESSYERLKASKRADESFSDVIDRLTNENADILDGFGIFEPEGGQPEYADLVAETHKELGEDLEEQQDDIF